MSASVQLSDPQTHLFLEYLLHVLDSVGSDSLSDKLHSATQRWGLVVKEGLLEVHLSHLSDRFKYLHTGSSVVSLHISILFPSR